MGEICLNIDGREVVGFNGQTILEIALQNGVEIPTLCHDDRVEVYGSCGICVVEAEGNPKLLRSCSTAAQDGMIIRTKTDRVIKSRKTALELLLSDHTGDCRPPCVLACPAQTDCQGYVGLIANGEYREALKLIKDKIPLPASIGRVCPHPCETACRRQLVEEPVSIAALKQFIGDLDLSVKESCSENGIQETGKQVAIIGGGPGGLTAAYFLRLQGHAVTVFDAMPHMGGMLRYGIPEYRLSKRVLQEEIDSIEKLGVTFRNNMKIGRDISLEYLRNTYNAVIVAVGAWTSSALRCKGEELKGVIGGIDFLRDVALNKSVYTGQKIAVVGGGNTAMDCARTAIRLGASEVYNVYRRTKQEMPAEEIEILEAEEEGVIFKNLTNPNEVVGDENGHVKSVRLQVMELGEPDASGRRAPVPVEGKEEIIEVDTVIVAIGQKTDGTGFADLDKTKWQTIAADENSFLTNLEGVFAIGDATNKGADIAIAAIGEAKKAAEMVGLYLSGKKLSYTVPYLVKTEKTKEDFAGFSAEPRARMPHRCAEERRTDFLEINHGLSEEEAKREASRCLECGCQDYFECKLIGYANRYRVQPEKLDGMVHKRQLETNHPFIQRNPDKCILCGLCVRICSEVVGATALGLVDRGFDTVVQPAFNMELQETDCISCGQCVHVCPTGALTETMASHKRVPVKETVTETTCAFCSVGCKTKLTSCGNLLLRSLPSSDRDSLLCVKGRFGFGETGKGERITTPMIKRGGIWNEEDFQQAVVFTNKHLHSLQTQYGDDCIAVAVSDRCTNEEAYLIKEYANKALKTNRVFSFGRSHSGLADVFGRDASTATLEELLHTDLIVVVESNLMDDYAVAGMRIRQAVKNGAKLLLLSKKESLLSDIATKQFPLGIGLELIPQVAKVLLEEGHGKDLEGQAELLGSLKDIAVSKEATDIADLLLKSNNAIFVYEKDILSISGTRMIGNLALLSGHSHKPRNGVIQLLSGANSQGLSDLGIESGEDYFRVVADKEIRGLFIFGEDVPAIDFSLLDFLAVQDIYHTETTKQADIVFPAAHFAEISGTVTSSDGKVQKIEPALPCALPLDNVQQIDMLAEHAGVKTEIPEDLVKRPEINPRQFTLMPVLPRCLRAYGNPNTNILTLNLQRFLSSQSLRKE